jgi:hypothetical protein
MVLACRLTVVFFGALVLGCNGSGCCDDTGCPRSTAIHQLCDRVQGCTVDGQHATCVPDNCPILFLPRGEVLGVPLETVRDELLFAPHLIVQYANGGGTADPAAVYPDPANAEATIDGVRGISRIFDGDHEVTAFVWEPLPVLPHRLEFVFRDGTAPVEVLLSFVDAQCQADTRECQL